jgi:hypothetical protein
LVLAANRKKPINPERDACRHVRGPAISCLIPGLTLARCEGRMEEGTPYQ